MPTANKGTYAGFSMIWGKLNGQTVTEPKNIGWGTGGGFTGSANSNVALFAPASEARVAGTSTAVTTSYLADTYQDTGTITASSGKTITEVGFFDTTTASGTTTIGTSLAVGTTVITLGAAIGPTTLNFYAQIGNETVLVTGGQNTTTITVTRAQLGSSAGTQPSGTPITVGGDGGAHANYSLGGQTATVSAALGGNMFAHCDFGNVVLNTNDSIAFTLQDQLTS